MLIGRWQLGVTVIACLAACGGKSTGGTRASGMSAAPGSDQPDGQIVLAPKVEAQHWYRSKAACAQGPFELEVPIVGGRYGEEVELHVHTPRNIALHAVILADDAELAKTSGVFANAGPVTGRADNARCIADARERLSLGRPGGAGGGPPGTPVATGTRVPPGTVPAPPSVTAELELDPRLVTGSLEVLRVRLPEGTPAGGRIRIRLWSIEPNDLDGVLFGIAHLVWRPNVGEARYEAHLAELAAREDAERRRRDEARRLEDEARARRDEATRLQQEEQARLRREQLAERQRLARLQRDAELAERARLRAMETPAQRKLRLAAELAAREEDARLRARLELEAAQERAARQAREDAERERAARRAQEEERARAARHARAEAERQRRAIKIALALERRTAFCAAHPEDRGCWGAGGRKVHIELEQRKRERAAYCEANLEDARCWSSEERRRREVTWEARVRVARAQPKPPEGPPPAPLAEVIPPRLSDNADWRPGYWHWIDGTWMWLAGMWRVPESDIVAELTTRAPAAPPPVQIEVRPAAPVQTAVWIDGFWQWSGAAWVWIPGAWQLRPASMTWRAPEWRPRGAVHVLIPGGWVRLGGRR